MMATQAIGVPVDASLSSRVDAMYARDRFAASLLVVVLWATVFFVMLAVRGFIPDPTIELVCWIGAALLLLFNTSSILAMIRHYAADKEHIYAVDIKHLDAGR
jgi:hypothetical protein